MDVNQATPGNFCWFELATNDQAAAKKFYSELFGWTADDVPMGPDSYYTMFHLRGKNVGAAYQLSQEGAEQNIPPHWGTYVAVANADEAAGRAKTLGGTVLVEPFDVAEHGRMAVVRDPAEATISLWQAKQHLGVGVWGEQGAFCWSELMTRDTEAATKFYTSLFGWKIKVTDTSGFQYTHWQNAGVDIGGMLAIMEQWGPMPPCWVNYIQVDNCDAVVEKATSLGGRSCVPPTDIANTGRFAMLQDPQGAVFAVIALAPTRKA